jgi:hypothetical protein
MVKLKIDGMEFSRTVIGKNSHQPNNVDHFYTSTVEDGATVIHSHTFKVGRAVRGEGRTGAC